MGVKTMGKKATVNLDLSGLPTTMAWYPVVTVYGMEDKFAADLITAVRNSDMPEIHDAVEQVFVPVTYTRTKYTSRGTQRTRTTKTAGVWSMYAFIRCRMTLTLWDFIRTSSGLMMMLASAGMPVPIPDAEMEKVLSACTFDGYNDDEIDHLMRQRRLTHIVEIDPADVEAEKEYKAREAEAKEAVKEKEEQEKEREKAERKAKRAAAKAAAAAEGKQTCRRKRVEDDDDEDRVVVRRVVHAGVPVVADAETQARRDARKHERAVAVQAASGPSLIGEPDVADNGDILLTVPGAQLLDDVIVEQAHVESVVSESAPAPVVEPEVDVVHEPEQEPESKPKPEQDPEPVKTQKKKKKELKQAPRMKKTPRMSALERFVARAAQAKQPKTVTVNKVNLDKLFKENDEIEVIDGLMVGKRGYVMTDQAQNADDVKVLLNDYDMPFTIDVAQLKKL